MAWQSAEGELRNAVDIARCEKCDVSIRFANGSEVICPTCRRQLNQSAWVCLVKAFSKPEDKGVGDTVQRYAAMLGGEKFKAWAEDLGIPCGCTERQLEWNKLWPY